MAYTDLSIVNPVATQDGDDVPNSARTNDLALRDGFIMEAMKSFVFSQSSSSTGSPTTTVDQPAYWFFKSGAIWLRGTITWGAGAGTNGNPTQIVWDLSSNTGGDYTTGTGGNICTQTFSWDATTGALTATTGAGSGRILGSEARTLSITRRAFFRSSS